MKNVLKAASMGAVMFGFTGRLTALGLSENKEIIDVLNSQQRQIHADKYVGQGRFANCDYRNEYLLICYTLASNKDGLEMDLDRTVEFYTSADEYVKLHRENILKNFVIFRTIGGTIFGAVFGATFYAKLNVKNSEVVAVRDSQPLFENTRRQLVSKNYCCPITGKIMKYPVTASDGRNYERAALMDRIRKGERCNLDGEKFQKVSQHKWFTFNKKLSDEIAKYLKQEEMLAGNRQRRIDSLAVGSEVSLVKENGLRFR